jgi:hypothetical protein
MKTQQHAWWESTQVKYSVVLKGFNAWINSPKTNKKTDVYDNRHLKMKPN